MSSVSIESTTSSSSGIPFHLHNDTQGIKIHPSNTILPINYNLADQEEQDADLHFNKSKSQTNPVGGSKKTQYHKTKLCPWHKDQKCYMGSSCNYAHTWEELRPKPDLSRTKLCPDVVKNQQCTRPGCRFAHDYRELRATSAFFKTRLCKFWMHGSCPAGSECRHAHGRDDLRASAVPDIDRASSSRKTDYDDPSEMQCFDPPSTTWQGYEALTSHSVSPSFLSTSTSTSSPGGTKMDTRRTEQSGEIGSSPVAEDIATLVLLRSLISQELERQFSNGGEFDGDDVSSYLPMEVLQGLNSTPKHRGWGQDRSSAAAATAASPTSFAAAVQSLSNGTGSDLNDRTPAQLLLKSLGDLTIWKQYPTPSPPPQQYPAFY